MTEATYRLRVNLVKQLRMQSGKSWAKIAKECGHVHPGTVTRRWLKWCRVRMDHIGLLAKALGTTADRIILPDGEEDLTDYVTAEVEMEGNLRDLKQPDDIAALLEEFQKRVGDKFKILLMYAASGSIRIGIKLHINTAIKMSKAFLQGKLHDMKVTAFTLKSSFQETQSPTRSRIPEPDTNTYKDLQSSEDRSSQDSLNTTKRELRHLYELLSSALQAIIGFFHSDKTYEEIIEQLRDFRISIDEPLNDIFQSHRLLKHSSIHKKTD